MKVENIGVSLSLVVETLVLILRVGKQTPCMLSFMYILMTSQVNLTVRTKPNNEFKKLWYRLHLFMCKNLPILSSKHY